MPVTLDEVAEGAAPQLFDHEIKKVLANIADPNTDTAAKRSFSLKFTISPDANGLSAHVAVEVGSEKLAPIRGATTGVFLETLRDGTLEMLEVQQRELPLTDNVRSINDSKE